MKQILVIDDDERLRELLSEYLSSQEFFVATAKDAKAARELLDWISFDAMILDRMMPWQNGLDFAKTLPEGNAPILMLTAMGEAKDRIEGLETGVQDYLSKPFEPRELVLRLNNMLKSSLNYEPGIIAFGPFEFDASKKQLSKDNEPIHLTTAEVIYLSALIEQSGTPVSREVLAEKLSQSGESVNARSVDVQINRLRKKIEINPSRPVYIQTVRGEGYIFKG